jgi:hypothetical protein
MSEFLSAVKADLLDRHRLPYLIALSAALVGVLAYAALGGGSSSTTSPTSRSSSETATGGIAISPAPNATDASAEALTATTQSNPTGRNFFQALPGSGAAAATASPSTGTKASGSSGSVSIPGSGSPSTGGETSNTPPQKTGGSTPGKPSAPSKPKPKEKTYEVSLLFGVFSPPPAISQLTPYPNANRGLQLPSPELALVTFSGWTSGGAAATFTLSGEAIVHGPAVCVPSPQQCTSITLKPGEAEQLEHVTSSGAPTTYELQVVSITPSGEAASASAARTHMARAHAARRRSRHRS